MQSHKTYKTGGRKRKKKAAIGAACGVARQTVGVWLEADISDGQMSKTYNASGRTAKDAAIGAACGG